MAKFNAFFKYLLTTKELFEALLKRMLFLFKPDFILLASMICDFVEYTDAQKTWI